MGYLEPWYLLASSKGPLIFALVLARISGIFITGPPLGTVSIPIRARGMLSVALSFLITSTQIHADVLIPRDVGEFGLFVTQELLVGMSLGIGVMLLFSGIQLGGSLIGTISGMSLSDVINPGFDQSVPLFSQVLFMFATAVFCVIGGNEMIVGGLLDTYATIPAGRASISTDTASTLITISQQSVALGLRVSAPITLALLLSTLVMGLISRTLPQLNILMFGFGVNAIMMMIMLTTALGGLTWIMGDQIRPWLELILDNIPVVRGDGSIFD